MIAMREDSTVVVAVLLASCFGNISAKCNCDYTQCPEMHVCYNCDTLMDDASCIQNYTNYDMDSCRRNLASSSFTKALYELTTAECILTSASCGPRYSSSTEVLFTKSCVIGCSNYTITALENTTIIGSNDYTLYPNIFSHNRCQQKCIPPLDICSVSYDFLNADCYAYTTNCQGSCQTEAMSGWSVYTVTCNGNIATMCSSLTSPANGEVNTSAGFTPGDRAIFSCDLGYSLIGYSIIICGSDGLWNASVPTCELVDCGELSNPASGFVSFSTSTYSSQAVYDCKPGYTINGTSVRTCDGKGNWTYSAPTCEPTDCGNLFDPHNGIVLYSSSTVGSLAFYECNTGYELNGTKVRTCNKDGSWSHSPPTCALVDCGQLTDPLHGTVSYSSTTYGSQANYSCNTGYVTSSITVRTCNDDGHWENVEPACAPVDCGPLSNPSDGNVLYSSSTYGSQAQYECNNGFIINGTSVRTCSADGNWTNTVPACNPVDCGPLSNPLNGTVSYPSSTFGSQATYECHIGFKITSDPVRRCNADGNWDSWVPTCALIDCGSLTDPLNGNVSYSSTTFSSEAHYSCNKGYTVSNTSIRTCNSDGHWDAFVPECTPVDCGWLSDPSDGKVSFSSSTYGSQATYKCNTGFTISSSSIRTCTSEGYWDNTVPTCTPVDCGPLSDPSDGTVLYSSTTYGSYAFYKCNTGFMTNSSSKLTCNSDGHWDIAAPTCKPVDCGPLPDPSAGTVSYSSTTYGSQAIYSCMPGLKMNGSSVRTCDADGNWVNAAPTCPSIDCGSLASPEFGSFAFTETSNGAMAVYKCREGYNISGPSFRTCLPNGTWDSSEPKCFPVDCGPLEDPNNGSVNTHAGTTFGMTATYTCDPGYVLSNLTFRVCRSNSVWSGTSPTCNTYVSSRPPVLRNLYILPCMCNNNRTFVNLTQDEIIRQLVTDTTIKKNETTLAVSRRISRGDSRTSSKMIGGVAIAVMVVAGGYIFSLDIMAIYSSIKALKR